MKFLALATMPALGNFVGALLTDEFISGILVTVVVEEIIPAAHEGGDARFAHAVFVLEFGLFTLLSVYLG